MAATHDDEAIAKAWATIERVLAAHAPEVAATLRAPASADDIERLERAIGRPMPADFVASLRIHDGQDNPTFLLDLFDHQTLMGVDAIIEHAAMRASALGDDIDDIIEWMVPDAVRPIMHCRGWVQFSHAEGEGLALDLDPLPAGVVGQIIWLPIDGPTPTPEHPSFAAWLTDLAERFDTGAFRVDETGGIWLEA